MGTVVAAARAALGPLGVFLPIPFTQMPSMDRQRAAARRFERVGYRAVWTNEAIGGKDALVQLGVLLAATERLTVGTGIANIWARQPQTAQGAAAGLAQAYPDRFVLGLGVGCPEQAASVGRDFGRPVATLRDYLDRMTAPPQLPLPDGVGFPRIIGANGPKLLALAAELADGALPAGRPVEFTAEARSVLGPDKLLVVAMATILDADRDRASTAARQRVTAGLGQPGAVAALTRLGYPEDEVTSVSDRVVDALVAHGDADAIAVQAREHRAAGADHVLIMPSFPDFETGVEVLTAAAPALLEV